MSRRSERKAKEHTLHSLKVTFDQTNGLESRKVRKERPIAGTLIQHDWLQQIQKQINEPLEETL